MKIKARADIIKIICGCMLGAAGVLLEAIARNTATFAQWYVVHIYPIWVNTVGRIFSIFPCSIAEICLYLLIIWIVARAILIIWKLGTKRHNGSIITAYLADVFLLVTVLMFLYVANCGINYYRTSFADSIGLQVEEYSVKELTEVCRWLTDEVNVWSDEIQRNEDGVMEFEMEETAAVEAMQNLGRQYSELRGYYPRPKGLLVSQILSIQSLTGVYSPFTIEANYNDDMTAYNKPFTMCHELSHLRGFMQEKEANFIAFLACSEAEEADFRYSGYLEAWVYCMNVLYKVDYDVWKEVRDWLSPEIEADLDVNNAYWARYDGKVAEVSNQINDTYLRANGQDEGVQGYDRMVDLIVAYYKNM